MSGWMDGQTNYLDLCTAILNVTAFRGKILTKNFIVCQGVCVCVYIYIYMYMYIYICKGKKNKPNNISENVSSMYLFSWEGYWSLKDKQK